MRNWLLLILFTAMSMAAAAQVVYRWVDEQGGVHYSDQPLTDRPSTTLRLPPKSIPVPLENNKPEKKNGGAARAAGAVAVAAGQPEKNSAGAAPKSESVAAEVGQPEQQSAADPIARAKACADTRQQLAYLDLRAVAKPFDDPNRTNSRELDSDYRHNLAAYERFQATRSVHMAFIAENCSD